MKDAFSGRIVGYSIDERMKASLAVAALRSAIEFRRPCATIVHSDRGSQFRSKKVVRLLRAHGLIGSMGRTGSCADNAAIDRSSPYCSETCWTAGAGSPARSSAWRSSSGSSAPTIDGVVSAGSASSPRSSSKPFTERPMPRDHRQPFESTELGADPRVHEQ